MRRREFTGALAASLASAAAIQPANKNVKWGLSLGLWSHFPRVPFTDVLDVMRDTGFIGLRVGGYPGLLQRWDITPAHIEKELSKRKLRLMSVACGGPLHQPDQRVKVLTDLKNVAEFAKSLGAAHLTLFTGARTKPGENREKAFKELCERCNQIGELVGPMGLAVGVHNHLDHMIEQAEEIDRLFACTHPKLVGFTPGTAHLHLAGVNVPACLEKHKDRLRRVLDYKDAKWRKPKKEWTEPNGKVYAQDSREARFLNSINDLGDGEIDFAACHKVLKSINYKGWICIDLDVARKGPLTSYERCGAFVVNKLEPVYL